MCKTQRKTGLNMSRFLLGSVLTMLASATAAQVFECVDAKGARQYAQFCPPGTVQQRQVEGTGSGATGPVSPATAPKSIDAQDVEFRKRELERREADTKAAQEAAKAEEFERNCIEARGELKSVEEGRRMQRYDPVTGERIQFGDDERAAEAERQRKAIAQWCK
jgi:hypothetical protein